MAIRFHQNFCVVGVDVCISRDTGILGETDSNLRYRRGLAELFSKVIVAGIVEDEHNVGPFINSVNGKLKA